MLRSALAAVALALSLTACSESEGTVTPDDATAPAAVAEAVAAEVHEALGVSDDIEVDDPIVEPCYDSMGRDTGEVSARVHSRAEPGVVTQERFDGLGERLGAEDVRRNDLRDPLDETRVIGQAQQLFADRDGRAVFVSMQLTDDDGFAASIRAECP